MPGLDGLVCVKCQNKLFNLLSLYPIGSNLSRNSSEVSYILNVVVMHDTTIINLHILSFVENLIV